MPQAGMDSETADKKNRACETGDDEESGRTRAVENEELPLESVACCVCSRALEPSPSPAPAWMMGLARKPGTQLSLKANIVLLATEVQRPDVLFAIEADQSSYQSHTPGALTASRRSFLQFSCTFWEKRS